jgi:hypothetical protein
VRPQHFGGPLLKRCLDPTSDRTWRVDQLAPRHPNRDESLRQEVSVTNPIEFELVAICSM